ncbi:(p)ppGpp synthetase [Azoarcus sp. TTM-91]|uniref:RelA/SpoT domain-containing protein n=1 Tax=Azoarcus sp. TTM-91 TaxID=2691581 RepID=UPI00145D54D9|nr:RelA/SpoT domain-containing protein [Azoarcus sp. TTM-91]NMG37022.1 (p)ppGpp synthetase [Azoarcus sp. TTM-91]
MAHETLRYSRAAVDRAGRTLLNKAPEPGELEDALDVLANWRSSHAFPLNTITMDLRQKARRVQPAALVVQRLKRARSILAKLSKESSMRLTQMQDIGGCRAVVQTIDEVYTLRDAYRRSKSLHEFVGEDNYIVAPKRSGYRSVHLVFRFHSRSHPEYNKFLFEIQLRTRTQHSWATAVETVGAVIGQALKSSEGERSWLSYFQNASIALQYLEQPKAVATDSASRGNVARTLSELGKTLQVTKKLSAYRTALKATEKLDVNKAGYFLLVLLPDEPELQIFAFSKRNADAAYREYEKYERLLPLYPRGKQLPLFPDLADYSGAQAVLVGADSLKSIRESYPNYYLDTEEFLKNIERFIRRYRHSS